MISMPKEADVLNSLREEAASFSPFSGAIRQRARRYVETIRQEEHLSPVQALQREYSLSSEEGILLMCLAEALLRIPDAATADALIRDKLTPGAWDRHVGLGRPWFLNWAGRGLEWAGKISAAPSAGELVATLVHRLGEPLVRMALRQAMTLMGGVFVFAGEMNEARRHAASWHGRGYRFSFDMLGEGARTAAQAERYFSRYMQAVEMLGAQEAVEGGLYARDGISIKLSALHPRLELRHWTQLEQELLPRLAALAQAAAEHSIPLTMDAEEATRLEVTLRLFEALVRLPSLHGYEGLGLAVQAYQTRAYSVLEELRTLAEQTGRRIPVRLVKGAYWDAEIKRAQMEGLEAYPVFTRKCHTDVSYLACAEFLLTHQEAFYPQFATHNVHTVAAILERAPDAEYEFQRLHGMGEALYEQVVAETKRRCRIYAPVGHAEELLSYLIRRILENGANASFVRGLADTSVPVEALLADPLEQVTRTEAHPLPLPMDLYPERKNSRGFDLGSMEHLAHWSAVLAQAPEDAVPPPEAMPEDCAVAYSRALAAYPAWAAMPVEARAAALERLADLLEARRERLVALLVHEAGKTLADALAEVREAADFCRYYASEARKVLVPQKLPGISGESNILTLHPRGVIVAISPWNFPLAIFTGQIVAALVAGNCVLAKPAEQTPKVAAMAVALMHEAGIPTAVAQMMHGAGEVIGVALVADPRCAGVVFTGGTDTARAIHRALAAGEGAIVPLIAETGGQNCMVVDSSALIEQTVDDIIASAFLSAGQRCSALRVLFVQEEIADPLLEVLAGAMQELHVGDPAHVATDIGPIIDEPASKALHAHIARMQREARWVAATPLSESCDGRYVAPHAFEIASLAVLEREIFGPILHVIRYRPQALEEVIAQINATGYALTFGIQSRIDAHIRHLAERVRAGNIYINRPMTGAVVGAQPFGGYGLSGTGPKAGGPLYLPRFCVERVTTTNTAAIGGNLDLLR